MRYLDIITTAMPSIVAVLYGITAFSFFLKKDIPWTIVWASYALANVGLILAKK